MYYNSYLSLWAVEDARGSFALQEPVRHQLLGIFVVPMYGRVSRTIKAVFQLGALVLIARLFVFLEQFHVHVPLHFGVKKGRDTPFTMTTSSLLFVLTIDSNIFMASSGGVAAKGPIRLYVLISLATNRER